MSELVSTSTAPPEAVLSATPSELVVDTAVVSAEEAAEEPQTNGTLEDQAIATGNINPKRLYFSNVSYQTTEDDLKELLKDYNIISVIVPSQTIRGFKSFYQKSLGVAYVEFGSESDTELAKVALNGKLINDRALRVKTFIAYSPGSKSIKRTRSRRVAFGRSKEPKPVPLKIDEETYDEVAVESDATPQASDEVEGEISNGDSIEKTSGGEDTNGSSSPKSEDQEVSKDTVFISRLSPKATDGDLRLFFHEFGPTDVYIFKNRFSKKQYPLRFHQRHVSALVTLTVEDGVRRAVETLSNQKIKAKPVIVRAAYVSKVEDVKKAAAARQKKQEKLEEEAQAAAHAAIEKTEHENAKDSIEVVEDDDEVFEGFDNEKCLTPVAEA